MRLAIVTGGSRGLGEALCREYERQGWRLIELSRTAPHSYSVRIDLTDTVESARTFSEALGVYTEMELEELAAFGNAAVLGPVGPVEDASPEEIAAHFDVNCSSAVLFARAVVATFQGHECPKTFVNISSGAANRGVAGWSLYCASKAAMENFVRSIALEQRRYEHPIRAININPGVMDTDMQALVRIASARDFPELERYVRLHEEGSLASPRTVAERIGEMVAARPEAGRTYAVRH